METKNVKAYGTTAADAPLDSLNIERRDVTPQDVKIEILFCGICHSDLHYARNEWSDVMPTVYPCVPGHEIVGRVAEVGSAVTKFKAGNLVGVGCLVDSDRTCPNCEEGLEQFCPNMILTYGSPDKHTNGVTYGGYSESIVVDERFVLRVPENLALAGVAPLLCAGITTYAFTIGITDPKNGRVRESEWRGAMVQLRDAIFYCPHCSLENFYDSQALKASGGNPGLCWACAAQLRLPPRIRIGESVVMLNHDTNLFPHHIDDGRLYDFSAPVASIAVHPTNPGIWGLKNLSQDKWFITASDGSVKDVEPERSVTLAVGTKIRFGKTEGEIRT